MAPPGLPAATRSPSGSVTFQLDGAPATTVIDVIADGAAVSGKAVTTFQDGTHTVQVECAARDGDLWAVAGPVDTSTAEPGSVGDWSAVIVRESDPQAVAIWLSDPRTPGGDCAAWLGGLDLSGIGPENFHAVESGALVAPPDLAP